MAKVSFVFEESTIRGGLNLHRVEVFTIAGSNRVPVGTIFLTAEEVDALRHTLFYGSVGSMEADVSFILENKPSTT